MQLFQDFFDQSKKLNQAPLCKNKKLPCHGQTQKYKIILIGLKIPNLPAPLHYLNFFAQIGQSRLPILRNEHLIQTYALDTVSVMSSISPHMVGQLNSYSLNKDCIINDAEFNFAGREHILSGSTHFEFRRDDSELSFELNAETTPLVSCFSKLRMGLAEHWSALSYCTGEVIYKGERIAIEQQGALEFARSWNFPYFPVVYYCLQIINLSDRRQLIFMQVRDTLNRVLQSRIYIKDPNQSTVHLYDQAVIFNIHRVYPRITAPNSLKMYLPREFEWKLHIEGLSLYMCGQSRGDFKFGLGSGFAGSFSYSISLNGHDETGESGYCEYIDCRTLNWQEQNQKEKLMNQLAEPVPIFLKK